MGTTNHAHISVHTNDLLKGKALWLVPPADVVAKLKCIMDNPPLEQNDQHPLPLFHPHVTLASVPSSVPDHILRTATPVFEPFWVSFKAVDATDAYFRSAIVHLHDSPQLSSMHTSITESLQSSGVKSSTPMFPHMSLYYVPDGRAADRQRVLDNLFRSGQLVESESGLAIHVGVGQPDTMQFNGFVSSEVWLVSCEGPVPSWKVLEKLPGGSTIKSDTTPR